LAVIRGQQQRIKAAQTALDKLASKPGDDPEQLHQKVAAILKRHRVNEFFSVTVLEEIRTQNQHKGRGRPTKNSIPEQVSLVHLKLQISLLSPAIEQAERLAGWRLFVTNATTTKLALPQAVIYYRDEWLLERSFHRFKRGSLPALPIYFQNQDRIVGLMFLLNIALRVFTLIEFVVQQALQSTQQSLAGLYVGEAPVGLVILSERHLAPQLSKFLRLFVILLFTFFPIVLSSLLP